MIKGLCQQGNLVNFTCTVESCTFSSQMCSDNKCSCHTGHQLCSIVLVQNLIQQLIHKDQFLSCIILQINEIIQKLQQKKNGLILNSIRSYSSLQCLANIICQNRFIQVSSKQISQVLKTIKTNTLSNTNTNIQIIKQQCIDFRRILSDIDSNIISKQHHSLIRSKQLNNISQLKIEKEKQKKMHMIKYRLNQHVGYAVSGFRVYPRLDMNLLPQINTLNLLSSVDILSIKLFNQYCPNLTHLQLLLQQQSFQNILLQVSYNKKITKLVLRNTFNNKLPQHRNKIVEYLCNYFKHLVILGLEQIDLNLQNIQNIVLNIQNLQGIGLLNSKYYDKEYISFISKYLPSFEQLQCSQHTLDLQKIQHIKNLKQLAIKYSFDESSINLPNLQTLIIRYNNSYSSQNNSINLNKLKSLRLIQFTITDTLLQKLNSIQSLKQLHLHHCQLSLYILQQLIKKHPHILILTLSTDITDDNYSSTNLIKLISQQLPDLQRLYLSQKLTCISFMNISNQLKSLKQLKTSIEQMNDVQILYLTTLKRMEDIYIDQFHILTPIQIYRLIRNKKKMIFNSNNINFYREGSSNKLIKNLKIINRIYSQDTYQFRNIKDALYDQSSIFNY